MELLLIPKLTRRWQPSLGRSFVGLSLCFLRILIKKKNLNNQIKAIIYTRYKGPGKALCFIICPGPRSGMRCARGGSPEARAARPLPDTLADTAP